MNMAQRIELKLELESSRRAGCEGCEVESVAKLPLWHSQTVHLSASTPSPPLALFCLVPLVLLSDCPVRFSFLTHAKLKMLTWSGHEADRVGGGQCGVGRAHQLRYLYELQATYIPSSSCCSCSSFSFYSRSTCFSCSSRCSLAVALFCSAVCAISVSAFHLLCI